jgi:hypothetical protein
MDAAPSWWWWSGCCTGVSDECRGYKTISLEDGHLKYVGFCGDVSFGGEYSIAGQRVDDFVANGPVEPIPKDIVENILGHLP